MRSTFRRGCDTHGCSIDLRGQLRKIRGLRAQRRDKCGDAMPQESGGGDGSKDSVVTWQTSYGETSIVCFIVEFMIKRTADSCGGHWRRQRRLWFLGSAMMLQGNLWQRRQGRENAQWCLAAL